MVRVKICGITNLEDARRAVQCGADALGFVFAKSPRCVTAERARRIVKEVGPWVATVGVFVDESPARIRKILRETGIGMAQLHGHEPVSAASRLDGAPVIKAFRVSTEFRFAEAQHWPAAALLFDAYVPRIAGGTGEQFEWKRLARESFRLPVVVSGGLTPRNVAGAVRMLRPYGVDVSSGVEAAPGKKNPHLVEEFIRNAKKIRF